MKFGHHGANHPVKDLDTGRVSITSQNHGFAVDADSLPARVRVTHVSLFDGSLQGIGSASGEDRAVKAAELAIASPLLGVAVFRSTAQLPFASAVVV